MKYWFFSDCFCKIMLKKMKQMINDFFLNFLNSKGDFFQKMFPRYHLEYLSYF